MELQFTKSVIPCLQTVAREVQTREQTQEVRLSDGMPDIGRVLTSWGQILLRGKQWHGGSAGASGGVMVWVLYAPEDGSDARCVETWLPFQTEWDFPDTGRDGTLWVQPLLYSVDARSLSARKLMVRVNVGVLGCAMVPGEAECAMPENLPDDVCALKNTYPVLLPVETGEKLFPLEEALSLPATEAQLERIVKYTLHPKLTDSKIVADKLVMRGVATLDLLYRGKDERLHCYQWELPLSQFTQLDSEYSADATAQIHFAVTALELEQSEEETLALKAGVTGQYVICRRQEVGVVEDLYSPHRTVNPQRTRLQLPAVLDDRTYTLAETHKLETGIMQVLDVVFYPEHPQVQRTADTVSAAVSGQFQLFGYDGEGQLQSAVSRWQDLMSADVSEDAVADILLAEHVVPQVHTDGESASLRFEIPLQMRAVSQQGIPMVTGGEMGEQQQPDPNRPSLILRYAGADSLWDIAKSTGSTVEAIQKANNLSREPDENQMLLIPVS